MWRRVVFWLVLIVIFFVFYEAAAQSRGTGRDPWMPASIFGFVAIASLSLFLWLQSRSAAAINRAAADIGEGRVVAGLAALDALKNRDHVVLHHYRGVALRLLWRLDESVAAFEAALRHSASRHIKNHAEPQLLLARALRGDAISAATDGSAERLATAVHLVRRQAWNDALSTLTLERIRPLGGSDRALAEALRAWAFQQTGQSAARPDLVGVVGEANTDAVKKYWPEFAAFLEQASAS